MEAEVIPMRQPAAADPDRPKVVNVQVSMNAGGDRQFVFMTDFPRDGDQDEANRSMDKLLAVADRAKARYDLIAVEADMQAKYEVATGLAAQTAIAETNHLKAQASSKEEIAEMLRQKDAVLEKAREDHAGRGRQGHYVPQGAVKQRMHGIDMQIKAVEEQIERRDGDKKQNLASIRENVAKYVALIEDKRVEANRLRAILGREPCTDYQLAIE